MDYMRIALIVAEG